LPVQVVDAEGKSSFTEFDNEGRLLRSIDGAGNETVFFYDESNATFASSSVPVQVDYPTYSQRKYYDKMQRLVQTTDILDENISESVSYNYDVLGRIISKTDKEGKTSYFEYDALSRLIKTSDAQGGVTELSYDDRDNVVAVKDANGGVTRFVYDLNDNKVKEIRPEGQETRYEYDAAGNLTAKFDAKGQVISYKYDALSRLIEVDYNSAKTVVFAYDVVGNLISYSDGSISVNYTYDPFEHKLS